MFWGRERSRIDEFKIQEMKDRITESLIDALHEKLTSIVLFDTNIQYTKEFRTLVIIEEVPEGVLMREKFEAGLLPQAIRNRVQLYVKTSHEFETNFQTEYLDLAVKSDILYDKDNYVMNKFGRLKKMMATYQLTRKKVFEGYVWEWRGLSQKFWHIDWNGIYALKDKESK